MKEILRKIKPRRLMWYAVFLLLTLVLQNMVFPQIRPLGVCPMVLPAAVVAVGFSLVHPLSISIRRNRDKNRRFMVNYPFLGGVAVPPAMPEGLTFFYSARE